MRTLAVGPLPVGAVGPASRPPHPRAHVSRAAAEGSRTCVRIMSLEHRPSCKVSHEAYNSAWRPMSGVVVRVGFGSAVAGVLAIGLLASHPPRAIPDKPRATW